MKLLASIAALAVVAGAAGILGAQSPSAGRHAHTVFFTLSDTSTKAREQLIAACRKYLSGHEGEQYFSVGSRAADLKRDVNVQDYDVALHIVFANRAAHDRYQTHPRHLQFVEENKANWKRVRVFDSMIE